MNQITRQTLAVLVDNEAGVLSRVVRLFSGKGYNIESLAVGTTDDPRVSRITIEVLADDKQTHLVGTSDSRKAWFAVGDYKRYPNEVGGRETALPEDVPAKMKRLLADYNAIEGKTLEDIIEFHVRFERIHPFQDGNGRVGRLLLFKECLKHDIVPFIIEDNLKLFYYRGLAEWDSVRGYLLDTCLTAQDRFKTYLNYFRIAY